MFKNKVALVTVGTSGIGYGISKQFLENGAKVIAIYRNDEKKAINAKNQLSKLGDFSIINADITNENQIKKVFSSISQLDYLVNCAGISNEDYIDKLSLNQIKETLDVNLIGKIICCRCALPLLKKSKSAVVINIASRFAERPLPTCIPYTTSMAAIVMLSKNLALEWAPHKIRVNTVSPSLTLTPLTKKLYTKEEIIETAKKNPLNRLGEVEDTANAVMFLCSDKASYINGENLSVNGGILLV